MKRAFFGLLTTLLLLIPVQAQNKPGAAAIKLAWHFAKGTELHFRQTMIVKQSIDMGQFGTQATVQKTTMHMKYSCEELDEKDVATLKVTYLRGQIETKDAKGKELQFDTANPDDEAKQSELVCKIVNAYIDQSFRYEVDATGKVLKVKDFEALQKRVGDASGLGAGFAAQTIGEESLKRQLELSFAMLPDEEVSKGDAWNRHYEQLAPMLGKFIFDIKCTYKGMKSERGYQAANIATEAAATLEVPKEEDSKKPALDKLKLEEAKLTGNYYFLPASSQFLKSEVKQHMVLTGAAADIDFKITTDTESLESLLTADDLKAEEAEVAALKEGKKTETPEKEPEKKDTPPVPDPTK